MSAVAFTVAGVPAPQGSKTRTKWGMREDNPATKPWRSAVAWEATAAMGGLEPVEGPLIVRARFWFPRPKSHYRTGKNAHLLKDNAPVFVSTKPDADKLVRACCDGMKGIVYRDDSQVAAIVATKGYGTPRAELEVWDLDAEWFLLLQRTPEEVSAAAPVSAA